MTLIKRIARILCGEESFPDPDSIRFKVYKEEKFGGVEIEAFIGLEQIGHMYLGKLGDYLSVDEVEIEEKYRGHGYGVKMYERAAEVARSIGLKGLASYPPNRNTNSNRVWNKLTPKDTIEIENSYYGNNKTFDIYRKAIKKLRNR